MVVQLTSEQVETSEPPASRNSSRTPEPRNVKTTKCPALPKKLCAAVQAITDALRTVHKKPTSRGTQCLVPLDMACSRIVFK
jgi:hypothetical protein